VSGEAVRGDRTLEAGGARPGELAVPHPPAAGRSSHLRTKERSASVGHPARSNPAPNKRAGKCGQRNWARAPEPECQGRQCGEVVHSKPEGLGPVSWPLGAARPAKLGGAELESAEHPARTLLDDTGDLESTEQSQHLSDRPVELGGKLVGVK
jgi:hypothetical protein